MEEPGNEATEHAVNPVLRPEQIMASGGSRSVESDSDAIPTFFYIFDVFFFKSCTLSIHLCILASMHKFYFKGN